MLFSPLENGLILCRESILAGEGGLGVDLPPNTYSKTISIEK